MAFRHPSPAGRNKKASPGASAPPPWAQPQRGTPTSQGGGSLDEDDEIADDASYLDPGDLEVTPASEVGRGFFRAVVPIGQLWEHRQSLEVWADRSKELRQTTDRR